MSDLLFVYGTLRQGHSHPMALYLARHAEYVAHGWCQGQMYQISDYPGVVASDHAHHRVYGEVYCLNNSPAVLAVLDEYEACSASHVSPTEYQRMQTRIHTLEGRILEPVWIYLYQWPVEGKALIKGGDFMQVEIA